MIKTALNVRAFLTNHLASQLWGSHAEIALVEALKDEERTINTSRVAGGL